MVHNHYIALVEFHVIGNDDPTDVLKQKLGELSECDNIDLENQVRTFKMV